MTHGLELLTPHEMAQADRLTIAAGLSGIALMRRAGRAVADVAATLVSPGAAIGILCGPGNNGGDGFVAAHHLAARGFRVSLGLLGSPEALKGDAARASRFWDGPIGNAATMDFGDRDLMIDAVLGAGLDRDLNGAALTLVARLAAWTADSHRPILAVDVPTGLDGNTGAVRGSAAPARSTVTFFRCKPGHILEPGRSLCGTLHCVDIGIGASVLEEIAPRTFLNRPELWLSAFPAPRPDGHKYDRGHALVVSGDSWTSGAARLSAMGALRAGAGLVTLATPRDAHPIHAAQVTAIMLKPCDAAEEVSDILADTRKNAVVLGPGLGVGEGTAALVRAALRSAAERRTVVLDADALTSFAHEPMALTAAIAASTVDVIITPHEGEFARLFDSAGHVRTGPVKPSEPSLSKLDRARHAAAGLGAVVLLKGSDTVVAAPDGRAAISEGGAPGLATAGSGDVLAGIIAGLAAQGMPAFPAACAGAWIHARAGALFGPGLISEDLAPLLPRVLTEIMARKA